MKNRIEADGFMTPEDALEQKHRELTEQYVENRLKELRSTSDPVTHPSHYTQGKYEVIDVIYDWQVPYPLDNVIKYVARFRYKDKPLEDLKKAQFYLNYAIKKLEEEQND